MGICIPSRDRLPPFQGRAGERLQITREILRFLGYKGRKKLEVFQEPYEFYKTYKTFIGNL
jgi:hypothetical protein